MPDFTRQGIVRKEKIKGYFRQLAGREPTGEELEHWFRSPYASDHLQFVLRDSLPPRPPPDTTALWQWTRRPAGWPGGAGQHSPGSFFVFIPVRNRLDLLEQAAASLGPLRSSLVIVNQTRGALPASLGDVAEIVGSGSFTSMQNQMQRVALEVGVESFAFMHNDARIIGDAGRILAWATEERRQRPSTGIVFTNYDAFAIFYADCVRAVGPWDEDFAWYVSDYDYYYRVKIGGWVITTMPDGVAAVFHAVSQTLAADKQIRVEAEWGHRRAKALYIKKWGGYWQGERFRTPYGR